MAHAKWAQQKTFVIAAKLFLTIIQFISVIKIPPAKIQTPVLFRYVT